MPRRCLIRRIREIIIYGHTTLFFWWPAWAIGFVFAVLNAGQENFLATALGSRPSSVLGLSYVAVILLLIVFTNVRLRGINSVVALLAVAFIAVVLAWFGWWDEIAKLIPYLSCAYEHGLLCRVFDRFIHHLGSDVLCIRSSNLLAHTASADDRRAPYRRRGGEL